MVGRPLQYLALAAYIVFLGFPLLFLLTTAFKTPRELQSPNPGFLPTTLNWDNFVRRSRRRTCSRPPATA